MDKKTDPLAAMLPIQVIQFSSHIKYVYRANLQFIVKTRKVETLLYILSSRSKYLRRD